MRTGCEWFRNSERPSWMMNWDVSISCSWRQTLSSKSAKVQNVIKKTWARSRDDMNNRGFESLDQRQWRFPFTHLTSNAVAVWRVEARLKVKAERLTIPSLSLIRLACCDSLLPSSVPEKWEFWYLKSVSWWERSSSASSRHRVLARVVSCARGLHVTWDYWYDRATHVVIKESRIE